MEGDEFRDRLLTDEAIVWTGQPAGGLLFTGRDIFLIPFSMLWTGFVVFWNLAASHGKAPLFFNLFGLVFLLFGLYFLIGRFFADMWIRSRLRYAFTDRRVLILRLNPAPSFTSLDIKRLPAIELIEGRNGIGTVRFGQSDLGWNRRGYGIWTPSLDPTPQFLRIPDARQVFDKIQQLSRA